MTTKEDKTDDCSTALIIKRLEDAIQGASESEFVCGSAGADIIAAAGEALGALRVIGGFSLSGLMYDIARLAAAGGYAPDDFEEKSRQ